MVDGQYLKHLFLPRSTWWYWGLYLTLEQSAASDPESLPYKVVLYDSWPYMVWSQSVKVFASEVWYCSIPCVVSLELRGMPAQCTQMLPAKLQLDMNFRLQTNFWTYFQSYNNILIWNVIIFLESTNQEVLYFVTNPRLHSAIRIYFFFKETKKKEKKENILWRGVWSW